MFHSGSSTTVRIVVAMTDFDSAEDHLRISIMQSDERSPLLQRPSTCEDRSISGYFAESWKISQLALPIWAALLLEYSVTGITVVLVGHLGSEEYASLPL